MVILRVNREKRFALDFENIQEMVSDYLQSADTSKRFKMYGNPKPDMVYGLAAYRELQTYIEQIEKGEDFLDIRAFTLLCEHKAVMAKRIRYLQKENAIQCSGDIQEKGTGRCKVPGTSPPFHVSSRSWPAETAVSGPGEPPVNGARIVGCV